MFLRKQQSKLAAMEETVREQLRLERDKEIEAVLTRLEEETETSQRESEAQVRSNRLQ